LPVAADVSRVGDACRSPGVSRADQHCRRAIALANTGRTPRQNVGGGDPKMRKHLASKVPAIGLELRSKTGRLSEADKGMLERFLTAA
jgi:hypothetical protein